MPRVIIIVIYLNLLLIMYLKYLFQKDVAMPRHRPGQHDGGGGARPWPSGAGGEARGAGPGTLRRAVCRIPTRSRTLEVLGERACVYER